jgi:hypothetical protein
VNLEPEARLGFWALALLVRLHRDDDLRAAVDCADDALKEFEAMAEHIESKTQKDQS